MVLYNVTKYCVNPPFAKHTSRQSTWVPTASKKFSKKKTLSLVKLNVAKSSNFGQMKMISNKWDLLGKIFTESGLAP